MRKLLVAALIATPALAAADPICRAVEIRFAPGAPSLQIAVWIEDANGNFVDTAYVTRSTGQFGLGNRPGAALMKTDLRWPYGRREMVLPIWAHRRNRHYPRVVMGGVCGNSPSAHCPDGTLCNGDCDDSTIAYHSRVSSYEPFYCSPSGASMIDAMSCASKGTFSKGAFAGDGSFSLYPPRADIAEMNPNADSTDLTQFAGLDDLVAVSGATPAASGDPMDPPVAWYPSGAPDGDYVAWVELSREADFNPHHHHQNQPDSVADWAFEGHEFLGQPSIAWRVPFHLDAAGGLATALDYAGYGAWDGGDGDLRPPDGTISDNPGSGAGRLLALDDGAGPWRVAVAVGACP